MQGCGATVLKTSYYWLNKWAYHDIHQSEMVLEGQLVLRVLYWFSSIANAFHLSCSTACYACLNISPSALNPNK